MKKVFTKNRMIWLAGIILLVASLVGAANAQDVKFDRYDNKGVTAVCKDPSGNVFVLRDAGTFSESGNLNAQVDEYLANGSVVSPLISNAGEYRSSAGDYTIALGIAVDAADNVYVTTYNDFLASFPGNILKFTKSGSSYNAGFTLYAGSNTVFGYFGSLAMDSNGNLYTVAVNDAFGTNNNALIQIKNASTASSTISSATVIDGTVGNTEATNFGDGTTTFDNDNGNYAAFTCLAVDASNNIFMANAWGYYQPGPPAGSGTAKGFDGGNLWKYSPVSPGSSTYGSGTKIITGFYGTALGCDPSGNVIATVVTSPSTTIANFEVVNYGAGGAGTPTPIYTTGLGHADFFPTGLAAVSSANVYIGNGTSGSGDNGDLYELIGAPAAATNVTFNTTTSSSTNIAWTSGSGSSRRVFMSVSTATTPAPANGTAYTANSVFGTSGTQIGASGWYCVYNGTGSSTSVTGLSLSTTYKVMVVDYNGSDANSDQNYNTNTASGNPANVTTATPAITAPGGTTTLTATVSGTPGSSTSFNISGSNLIANVTATAPANVQVSSDNSTWGSTATITESGGSISNQPVYVRLAGTGSVGTISGNVQLSSTSATTVNQAVSGTLNSPSTTIVSLLAANSTTTNLGSVQYNATFFASVSGLSTTDFTLSTSGVTGASIMSVGGSGTAWTVTVNTGSGNGTIQLVMNSSSGVSPSVSNLPFNGSTYTIDKTSPVVSSIVATGSSPTNASSAGYTVTFSEAVSGVDATDFTATVSGVSTTGISVTPVNSSVYTVTVNGVAGNGTLRLDLNSSGTGITDAAGNSISGGFTGGSVYNIDQTPPSVLTISASDPNPTNGTMLHYQVTFSEPVTGVDPSDFTATVSGVSTGTIGVTPVSTSVYNVTINSVSGSGTVRLDLKSSGTGITDAAGNAIALGFTGGNVYSVDQTPPAVTSVDVPANGTYRIGQNLDFVVHFSENTNVTGTPSIPVTIGSNTVNANFKSGSGLNALTFEYSVLAGDNDGDGIAVGSAISLNGGTLQDAAGNNALLALNSVASSTGVLVDGVAPTAAISAPSAAAIGAGGPGTISYTVTYADANFNTSNLTGAGITLNATGTATGTVGITGSGTSYTITISGITGLGTLGISVGAGYASDQAGNTDAGAGPSATFNVTTASTDATLSALSLSSGTLAPAFNAGTVSYTASVANGITSITVTPTATAGTSTITVNGATVASGAASASLPLNVGANAITTVVTAPDGGTTKTYTTTVTRAASATATLSFLRLTGIAISPAFTPAVTGYTASVANSVTSVTVLPTVPANGSTITVNGVTVASGATSGAIPLNVGPNTISTVVTAQNGITTKTYTITVTRTGASIATLAGLSISSGTLSPAFATVKTSYKATVANSVTSITVTPTTTDTSATVTVNGAAVTSGSASAALPLTPGSNTITTIVTAQDGVTMDTYTITLTRTPSTNANLNNLKLAGTTLSPAFAFATTSYTASVAASVSSTTVTPTVSVSGSTVTVNGVSVISGTPSGSIPLATGQNTITIVVTAQDGITTKTYTVVVTRPSTNANLAALAISSGTLAPAFATATTSYTASVANSVSAVTLTPTTADATAAVTVNGTAVASGSASGILPLNVGDNTITTVVTAQDGVTTKTYSVVVTRAPSANANILKVKISSGTLSPTFVQATTSYTDSVVNSVSSITVTPTASDATATITVNGTAVTSGTASAAIPLNVGPNTISIICLAQNGTTTKTYTVTVTRAPSSIATLSALGLSPGALAPAFAVNRTSYTASVANSVLSVTITPVTTEPNATVKVNGAAVASGAASGGIPLNVGPNTIATVVTAQDGSTTQTYTVTVTRAASTNANILKLKLSSGTLSPVFGQATTSYTASVANSVSSITATPTTSDANATVTVNGANVVSGAASAAIPLNVGSNTVTVICTAQDGVTEKTYTVTVTRASGDLNSIYQPISVSQPGNDLHLADNITVHQGVSPNGDGMNDVLVIDGITAYPDNKLSIMSRNGELVFEASGYDNSSRVFDGHSSKNGKMQSPGTYFYSLEYKVGEVTRHKTGFIVLKY